MIQFCYYLPRLFSRYLALLFAQPQFLFAIVSFSSIFRSVTWIDFTYHPLLFDSHTLWLDSILPLVQLLVKSFCLQYVCLFSHRDIAKPCPLHLFHSWIQDLCPTWFFSIHSLSSSSVGANVSCFRSLIYFSPHPLKLDSSFHVSTTESFPSPSSWLSPLFNTSSFSVFTSSSILSSPIVDST